MDDLAEEAENLCKEALRLFRDNSENEFDNIYKFYDQHLSEYELKIDSNVPELMVKGYVFLSVLYDAMPKPVEGTEMIKRKEAIIAHSAHGLGFLENFLTNNVNTEPTARLKINSAIITYKQITMNYE